MGASRRQHHRQQEGMRAANEEANRQRAAAEAQQRAFQEQLAAQRQAMLAQTEAMRAAEAPTQILSTLEAGNVGIRTARSTRGTTAGLARGVASLRIPLNVGGTSGSGLNIG